MSIEDDDFGRSFLDFSPAPVRSASDESGDPAELHDPGVESRAYLLTGGRTGGGKADVKLETMVAPGEAAGQSRYLTSEQQTILSTVQKQPMAVAEVAARTGMVLGVAQVLIGDLVHDGLLTPSRGGVAIHDDVDLIERMIARVAAL